MAEVLTPEQEQINSEQLQAVADRATNIKEQVTGDTNEIPEGFNPDGTPIEYTPTTNDEPILGKFKSQDDLIKAYQELEKKLSTPQDKEAPKVEENKVDTPEGGKLDISKFDQEFLTNGELSEESYKELSKYGFTKDTIDRYIKGQQALTQQYTDSIYSAVGGADNYNTLITWAGENLPQSTIDEYNSTLNTGNTEKIIQLLEYMDFKRDKSVPAEKVRIEPTSNAGGLKPFTDKGEWQQATQHRLYGKDAKYTNMIDKRYLAAKRAGNI